VDAPGGFLCGGIEKNGWYLSVNFKGKRQNI
jgi:hypothetical protein